MTMYDNHRKKSEKEKLPPSELGTNAGAKTVRACRDHTHNYHRLHDHDYYNYQNHICPHCNHHQQDYLHLGCLHRGMCETDELGTKIKLNLIAICRCC